MAFALSKILWILLAPAGMLVLMLGGGVVMLRSSRSAVSKWGVRLCSVVFLCFAVLSVFPVGDWLLIPLENRFSFVPPARVDGVIVIGGDEDAEISESRGVPVAVDSVRRYLTFADLAKRYPDAKLMFSGGSGHLVSRGNQSESAIAVRIISDIGVSAQRILVESKSRNTYENATMAAEIANPEAGQNWILVTSAWHMPRAMGCFRRAGWNIYAAPSAYMTSGRYHIKPVFQFVDQLRKLTMALHEYVGLAAYRAMGRTGALWPE